MVLDFKVSACPVAMTQQAVFPTSLLDRRQQLFLA